MEVDLKYFLVKTDSSSVHELLLSLFVLMRVVYIKVLSCFQAYEDPYADPYARDPYAETSYAGGYVYTFTTTIISWKMSYIFSAKI